MRQSRGMRLRTVRRWAALGGLLLGLAYAVLGSWPSSQPPVTTGANAVAPLYEAERSGEVIEGSGTVERLLTDDRQGSQHQRFILRLGSGHTVLVAHNIDLAPRVAGVAVGDRVEFRGQYEWNAQGGVIHWTHHDPAGRRPGGWLQHDGSTYR